ncbi:MAG TPA: phosphopantetheine-binding protein [Prosthecobacter sp.]
MPPLNLWYDPMNNMTATDLSPKLQEILRPHLRFLSAGDSVPMDQDLGRLGLDSMASIDLLMDIESRLGVQIPDEMMTADTFSTGNHLLAVIEKLV